MEHKKQVGRPAKIKDERLIEIIHIKVTASQKERWLNSCPASMGEWIRGLVEREINKC
jgi:hypothetical protein